MKWNETVVGRTPVGVLRCLFILNLVLTIYTVRKESGKFPTEMTESTRKREIPFMSTPGFRLELYLLRVTLGHWVLGTPPLV